MSNPRLDTQGLEIEVYRSKKDNKLVIDIGTGDLSPLDVHPNEHDIPDIRIIINEQVIEINPDGSLKEGE